VSGGCLPSNSKTDHVDGGFAAGASSFSRQGSPRCLSWATVWSATANRSSSVSPSFKPRMIFRERRSAKAIAYLRTSPFVIGAIEHKKNRRASGYILYTGLATPHSSSLHDR
jgi:hypothetical protein